VNDYDGEDPWGIVPTTPSDDPASPVKAISGRKLGVSKRNFAVLGAVLRVGVAGFIAGSISRLQTNET